MIEYNITSFMPSDHLCFFVVCSIMGAGGRMTEKEREKQEQLGRANGGAAYQRSPTDKPPSTLGQIKKAIPPHCFQRCIIKSFSYVVHDLVIVAALL